MPSTGYWLGYNFLLINCSEIEPFVTSPSAIYEACVAHISFNFSEGLRFLILMSCLICISVLRLTLITLSKHIYHLCNMELPTDLSFLSMEVTSCALNYLIIVIPFIHFFSRETVAAPAFSKFSGHIST